MIAAGSNGSVSFSTFNSSGATVTADSLPTATLLHNGVADGTVTVTVTHPTPEYLASFTVPSGYAVGDTIELLVSATVSGTTASQVLMRDFVGMPGTAYVLPQPPPPGYGGNNLVLSAPLPPPAGYPLYATQDETFVSQITPGIDFTGWNQILFTATPVVLPAGGTTGNPTLQAQLSNPTKPSDGMTKGGSGGSATIVVGSGQVLTTFDPAAMGLPYGTYRYALTAFITPDKKVTLSSGQLLIAQAVWTATTPNSP